jgi:hypothetical protein
MSQQERATESDGFLVPGAATAPKIVAMAGLRL